MNKKDTFDYNVNFLSMPCPTRSDGLKNMSPFERAFFEYLILMNPSSLSVACQFHQKTKPWFWLRKGRVTGSVTAPVVGHSRLSRPFPACKSSIQSCFDSKSDVLTDESAPIKKKFQPKPKPPTQSNFKMAANSGMTWTKQNQDDEKTESDLFTLSHQEEQDTTIPSKSFMSPMKWGSGKEVYAVQCYIDDLYRIVNLEFVTQRNKHYQCELEKVSLDPTYQLQHMKSFIFRNQFLPVQSNLNEPVHVEVRHYGCLIDKYNMWRGCSPDGVIFINGVACGALEIKCPSKEKYALYSNVKLYYYDQLMSELYMCNQYWPTIQWLDFVCWSPKIFTVELYNFDADYFFNWYAPRELRYYFNLFLPMMANELKHRLIHQVKLLKLDATDELVCKSCLHMVMDRHFGFKDDEKLFPKFLKLQRGVSLNPTNLTGRNNILYSKAVMDEKMGMVTIYEDTETKTEKEK